MKVLNKFLLPALTLSAFAIISSTNASATTSTTTAKPTTTKHTTASKKTTSKHHKTPEHKMTTTQHANKPVTQQQVSELKMQIHDLKEQIAAEKKAGVYSTATANAQAAGTTGTEGDTPFELKNVSAKNFQKLIDNPNKRSYMTLSVGSMHAKPRSFGGTMIQNGVAPNKDVSQYVYIPDSKGKASEVEFGKYLTSYSRVGVAFGYADLRGFNPDTPMKSDWTIQQTIFNMLAKLEIDVIRISRLSLSVGFGAGVAVANTELKTLSNLYTGNYDSMTDTAVMPKLEGSLGLTFRVTDRIDLFANYTESKMYGNTNGNLEIFAPGNPSLITCVDIKDLTERGVKGGIRYKF